MGDAHPAGSPHGCQAPHADLSDPLLGLEDPVSGESVPPSAGPELSECSSRGCDSVQPCGEARGSWTGRQGPGQALE